MDHVETAATAIAAEGERAVSDTRVARWLLAGTGLLFVAVYAPTFAWLWERWTLSVWHNAHGMFIPPLAGYLVWQELSQSRRDPPSSSAWGFALLIPALALHVLDTALHTELLSAISIVIAVPGLALLFLGVERTRAIAFPLAFLAFMLPIPLALTDRLHLVLRHLATWAASVAVPIFGVPVFADGTTLHMGRATLEVAQACSGFSTLYAALAVAVLTAYMADTWRRRVAVLVAAVPIALATNWARVVLLAVWVDWRGIQILDSWAHQFSGMLTFALALPAILWIGRGSGRAGRR